MRGIVVALVVGLAAAQDAPMPVWATPDRFWFTVAVAGGREWWAVDVRTGVRDRLFDHGRLAREINTEAHQDYSATTLPFAEPDLEFVVKYDGKNNALEDGLAIEFTLAGDRWRCELDGEWDWGKKSNYYCAKPDDPPAAPPASRPLLSPDGRWEASVQNGNVVVRAAGGASRVLSADGTPSNPYHLGSLRWSADSRTLTGYRVHSDVWRTDPAAGTVKGLITRQEWTVAK